MAGPLKKKCSGSEHSEKTFVRIWQTYEGNPSLYGLYSKRSNNVGSQCHLLFCVTLCALCTYDQCLCNAKKERRNNKGDDQPESNELGYQEIGDQEAVKKKKEKKRHEYVKYNRSRRIYTQAQGIVVEFYNSHKCC